MNRLRPTARIAKCRRSLECINRRCIASQQTQPSSSPSDKQSLSFGWEDEAPSVSDFKDLPEGFGKNQLLQTNEDFKRSLRGIVRQFPPITYAFAYGSGVFPQSAATATRTTQSPHPNPPEAILQWQKGGGKMIDFVLTPRFSQHFHWLNLRKHRDHYSFLASLGSGVVSHVQDKYGAGAYFNTHIDVQGTMIKYAVVNYETLLRDLTEWDTLYLAGRLQKPVKILFEEPNLRLANQRNLLSAVRCSLLLLPTAFTEKQLYSTITGLSYQGDPRMQYGSENPKKISNIVNNQLQHFRHLYHDIISSLPNIRYVDESATQKSGWMEDDKLDLRLEQDLDPERRGNIIRRLPKQFREKVYFQFRGKYGISGREYNAMLEEAKDEDAKGGIKKQIGGDFDRRIAADKDLPQMVTKAINKTVKWPSTVQSMKGILSAGPTKSWQYLQEKRAKGREK